MTGLVIRGRVKYILVNGERLREMNNRQRLTFMQGQFIQFCETFGYHSEGDFCAKIEIVDGRTKSLTFEGVNGGAFTPVHDDNMPWRERRISAKLEKPN